ncbi:lysozyme [Vibrio mediterranei]|nr:lysozyme [Vibrio mediterranei]
MAVIVGIVVGTHTELRTSKQGLEHIFDVEGCRSKAYQCSANKWTIGVGHASNVSQEQTVTNQEIADYYAMDIKTAESTVDKLVKVPVAQYQYDMFVSFVFNLGSGNFSRSTMLKRINENNIVAACNEFPKWVYVNRKNCNDKESNCYGIVHRREIEKNICLNGY